MGRAADVHDEESAPDIAGPDKASSEESAPEPSGSQNLLLYFPQCSGLDELPPDEAGCWKAISNHQECDFFLPRSEFSNRKEQFTWSADCQHNTVHGTGTLKYDFDVGDGVRATASQSGSFVEGRMQGNWVLHARSSDGTEATYEGPFVDGEWNGHWVIRILHYEGTEAAFEGPFVEGDRHGHWAKRYRYPDGSEKTEEVPYVDGKVHGRVVQRFRYPDGTENTVYWECHHGECEEQ